MNKTAMARTSQLIVVLLAVGALAMAQSRAPTAKALFCSQEKGSDIADYPPSLKGTGIEGQVQLQAEIGTDGCVRSVSIVHKLNPQMDKAAKDLVKSWKYKPATKDGKPVKVIVRMDVNFKDPDKQAR